MIHDQRQPPRPVFVQKTMRNKPISPLVKTLSAIGIAGAAFWMVAQARDKPTPDKAADKPAQTVRQTARPWTGSPLGPEGSFEYQQRARDLQIGRVMNDLGLKRGSVVGDIGAGGGWFTMIAAQRVGPQGRVYAEDILLKYTDFITQRARKAGLKNVRTILGTVSDPKLPVKTFDAVLILNAYHEFGEPLAMLKFVHAAMKPGAKLAFIERDTPQLRSEASRAIAATGQPKRRVDEQNDGDPLTDDHRLALPIIEREAKIAGFTKVTDYRVQGDHYVLIVKK